MSSDDVTSKIERPMLRLRLEVRRVQLGDVVKIDDGQFPKVLKVDAYRYRQKEGVVYLEGVAVCGGLSEPRKEHRFDHDLVVDVERPHPRKVDFP